LILIAEKSEGALPDIDGHTKIRREWSIAEVARQKERGLYWSP